MKALKVFTSFKKKKSLLFICNFGIQHVISKDLLPENGQGRCLAG